MEGLQILSGVWKKLWIAVSLPRKTLEILLLPTGVGF
jgi:hypothetical protein